MRRIQASIPKKLDLSKPVPPTENSQTFNPRTHVNKRLKCSYLPHQQEMMNIKNTEARKK